ncbi:MAG: hypothetical protein AAGE52_13685 [Myxococcota bacterium]
MRKIPCVATLAVLLLATEAQGQVSDRRVPWRTIQSDHFEISYPEPLGAIARRVAFVAERAHQRLSVLLDHDVTRRVQILVSDRSDSANGSATSIPYNQMELFVTAPEDLATLSDYDDWLTILVTHEHTHVLHLDTVHGWPAVVNAVLGKVYAPNLIQPRWFVEGIATYMESRNSAGGRLRSTLFEMYMRMAVLEGRMLRMDQLSTTVDRWPRSTAWYLYGSRFVEYIAGRFGEDALTDLSHEYGSRLIPYAVNRAARRVTGFTFVDLYDAWKDDLRREHEAVRDRVIAEGRVEGDRITFHGEIGRAPRFHTNDRLSYYVNDGHNDPQLRLIDRDGGNVAQLVRVAGESYASPQGNTVVYDAIDGYRDIYFFYDLFEHDRDSGVTTRLTQGRRARAPDISPNGRRLAFTQNSAGTTHLMVADRADVEGTAEVLLRSPRFHQVYTPKWSPDGRTIAISRWAAGGYRDIVLVDADSGDVRPVTNDRALDSGPAWSPDGRTLYFSSDRTGIANLYAYDLERGTTSQITNVIAGAYSPTVSPDGETIVYLGYTSYGFDLYRLAVDRTRWRPATPYVDDRPAPTPVGEVAAASSRYRPGSTLYPRGYTVDFQPDAFGTQLGINVTGTDIVGYHNYTARLGVSLVEGYVNADVAWSYNRLPASLNFRFFRTVAPRGGLQVGGADRTWIEDAIGGNVGFAYGFRRGLHSETISASYALSYLRQAESFGGNLDPNTPPPVLPVTGRATSLRVGWSYSDVRRHTYDMTPSEGRSLSLSVAASHPVIGSRFRSVNASWSWRRFVEAPWAQHHVFAFRYGGGMSGGDFGRRGAFSVGGFPEADIIQGFRDNRIIGGVALRGYPQFHRRGTRFSLLQTEYRFPIYRWMSGVQTLPVFLNRSYASVFVDVGDAWVRNFDASELRVGVGAELFLDFTVGYIVPFTFRVGFAYGLMDDAGPQFYYHLGVPF